MPTLSDAIKAAQQNLATSTLPKNPVLPKKVAKPAKLTPAKPDRIPKPDRMISVPLALNPTTDASRLRPTAMSARQAMINRSNRTSGDNTQ